MTGRDRPGRGCHRGLALGGLVLILLLTLFPFDLTAGSWATAFTARFVFRPINDPLDFLVNIMLFMPLGAGLGGWFLPGGRGGRRAWVLVALGGALLSAGIEGAQVLLPSRSPTLADILANALGLLVGVRWWKILAGALCNAGSRLVSALTWPVLGGLLIVHLVGVALLFRTIEEQSSFANWDGSYPLLCGNEATADRPWNGRVVGLQVWDRVVDPAHSDPTSPDGLLCRFDLSAPDDLADSAGHLPALAWRGVPPVAAGNRSVSLGDDHWLASPGAGTALSQALAKTGRFTISISCATADTGQTGPARIVSLSADPFHRNVTLGQEGRSLVVRVRTPFNGANGDKAELVVPGVFVDTGWRTMTVTCDGRVVTVQDGDGRTLADLEWRYAGALCRGPIGFHAADQFGYWMAFWGLVWVPGLVLVGLMGRRGLRS
ncbi:MAG: VanZ family protein [Candidatus Krumholzibacteria bacterium]|nr:VanZ family protein [Candidatus Krumholzibacteria bacterium]